jgi:ubiquinone/menaquinone biosynthesis C-methylase UbiE
MQRYNDFERLDFSGNYVTRNPVIRFLHTRFLARLCHLVGRMGPIPQSVLEVGAGEGFSTRALARCLPGNTILVSSDLIPELARRNKERSGNYTVLAQDISRLAIKSGSVDLVVALEVLEHLPDPGSAVRELARVTRRSAIVSVPFEPWWRIGNMLRGAYWRDLGNTPDHRNHWGKRSLWLMLSVEFSSVEILTSFPWLIAVCLNPTRKESAN